MSIKLAISKRTHKQKHHNLKPPICIEYWPVETHRGRDNEDTAGRTCRPSDLEDDHACKNDHKKFNF